jgi:hypothetical protein
MSESSEQNKPVPENNAASSDKSAESMADKSGDKSAENTAAKSEDKSAGNLPDKSVDKSAGNTIDKSGEKPMNVPSDNAAASSKPTEKAEPMPDKPIADKPVPEKVASDKPASEKPLPETGDLQPPPIVTRQLDDEPKAPSDSQMKKPRDASSPKPPGAIPSLKCTNCGHVNRVGELVCSNCGTSLVAGEKAEVSTKKFDKEEAEEISQGKEQPAQAVQPVAPAAEPEKPARPPLDIAAIMSAIDTAGSDRFDKNMMLRLEIEGAPTSILIYPRNETKIGRRDPSSGLAPDVDLTNYAGYRMGVSRSHCVIRVRDQRLEIYDLGSSNGTMLNGSRLNAHQPAVLRDGDELMLGKMVMKVMFQRSK